jgi:putative DNA primase/helicase
MSQAYAPSPRVYLNVPFPRNGEARHNGARFDGDRRQWYVQDPASFARCSDFMPLDAVSPWEPKDWQFFTYEQRAEAKAAGCLWDAAARCWYMP